MPKRIEVRLPNNSSLWLTALELKLLKAAVLEAEADIARIQETEFRRRNLDLFEPGRPTAGNI